MVFTDRTAGCDQPLSPLKGQPPPSFSILSEQLLAQLLSLTAPGAVVILSQALAQLLAQPLSPTAPGAVVEQHDPVSEQQLAPTAPGVVVWWLWQAAIVEPDILPIH